MKNARLIVLIMCIIMISSVTAYAHKMSITEVEEGVIQALYDDGSFSSRTEITVYDSNDEVITSGKLDDDGKFTYDASEDVSYIVADDGMGHRDEWEVGTSTDTESGFDNTKFLKIAAVVLLLGGVGFISYKKSGKK